MKRTILALLLALAIIPSCTKPKDLEFIDVQDFRIVKFGLSESVVGLNVRFYNPNKQRVKLKDVSTKVYANSTYLGDTFMDSTITVPRRDTFSIPLFMNVKTGSTISRIMQSVVDSTVNIKVDGSVKMGKAGVFVNYPIHYEHAQKLSDLNLGL